MKKQMIISLLVLIPALSGCKKHIIDYTMSADEFTEMFTKMESIKADAKVESLMEAKMFGGTVKTNNDFTFEYANNLSHATDYCVDTYTFTTASYMATQSISDENTAILYLQSMFGDVQSADGTWICEDDNGGKQDIYQEKVDNKYFVYDCEDHTYIESDEDEICVDEEKQYYLNIDLFKITTYVEDNKYYETTDLETIMKLLDINTDCVSGYVRYSFEDKQPAKTEIYLDYGEGYYYKNNVVFSNYNSNNITFDKTQFTLQIDD